VTRSADPCDVLVIGAGPAGSTAAQLLASWGWSVIVAHRDHRAPAAHPTLAESLPSSTRKLFTFLGQLDRIEAAGFHPNDGNVARWAGASRVTRTADAGFHVSRAAFDRVLRECALAAGARVVDAGVRQVDIRDPIRVTYNNQLAPCSARYVLDCSGRAGVLARRGLRRGDARYRTLAITAEWACEGWPAGERARTVVESYREGWAWSVPLSATDRQCTVMIEPDRSTSRPPERLALRLVYEREIARTSEIGARLAGARQLTAPWACDASIYTASRAAESRMLLVGDAASFIEPLSSAGVKKALLSAWRAAVVVNTCLAKPALAGAATDLYVRRERQVYADCMRRSRTFFAEAAAAYGTPFWSARAELADSLTPSGGGDGAEGEDITDEALARDADVRLAFDYLRASERVRLRPAAALRFEPVASIEGHEVVMRDALVVPGLDAPLRFAAGVNLPALARLATACNEVPALIAAYHAQVGPVPLAGLLTGLSLLVARRALVAEGWTS
jgi:flavin-dependent dehydrogenase